jgi:hypothetical protein
VGMLVPPTLSNVLDEFVDWMLDYFPKVLPPRCTIDHHIELEQGCTSN